jgi:hypothetical protein
MHLAAWLSSLESRYNEKAGESRRDNRWLNGSSQAENNEGEFRMNMTRRAGAEFFGTFWLTFGGCGSAVLAVAFPALGIGFLGVVLAFGLTALTMAYAPAVLDCADRRCGDSRLCHALAARGSRHRASRQPSIWRNVVRKALYKHLHSCGCGISRTAGVGWAALLLSKEALSHFRASARRPRPLANLLHL